MSFRERQIDAYVAGASGAADPNKQAADDAVEREKARRAEEAKRKKKEEGRSFWTNMIKSMGRE